MIKTTVMIVQLFVLIVTMVVSHHFLKLKSKASVFACCGCILVFSFLSLKFTQSFIKIRDEIKITALNEKSEKSKGTEVDIQNMSIDGEIIITTQLPISNGCWYLISNRYSWRPSRDTRWDGTASDSITLKIPVGWNREIRFHSNAYRGYVAVEKPNRSIEVLDTYSGKSKIHTYYIGRSETKLLLLQGISDIVCYTMILGLLTCSFLWTIKKEDLQK